MKSIKVLLQKFQGLSNYGINFLKKTRAWNGSMGGGSRVHGSIIKLWPLTSRSMAWIQKNERVSTLLIQAVNSATCDWDSKRVNHFFCSILDRPSGNGGRRSAHWSPVVARSSRPWCHRGPHQSSPNLGYGASNLKRFDPMGVVRHSELTYRVLAKRAWPEGCVRWRLTCFVLRWCQGWVPTVLYSCKPAKWWLCDLVLLKVGSGSFGVVPSGDAMTVSGS
jgi:hypothetical protein